MELADLFRASRSIVAFTGAGVSTESGIPDFRSPGGLWTRFDPKSQYFHEYVTDQASRAAHWAMRRAFLGVPAQPNPAHRALARLEHAGRSPGVITQNIDGLHQQAGSRRVVELHGTAREVMCIGHQPTDGVPDGCGWRAPSTWAFEQIEHGHPDPACPHCGGLVKCATVSFGQRLFPGVVDAASELIHQSDLVVVVGSSLQVYPAARLPVQAYDAGARLVIVNEEPTPYDDLADLVVRGRSGSVLPRAVDYALAS
jgi:NAD-dependent deacetylase